MKMHTKLIKCLAITGSHFNYGHRTSFLCKCKLLTFLYTYKRGATGATRIHYDQVGVKKFTAHFCHKVWSAWQWHSII